MNPQPRGRRLAATVLLLAAAVAGAVVLWLRLRPPELPPGIAAGNGRLEATEVDVATKTAGRLTAVLVREGDLVAAGQIVARLDADDLNAQLRGAEALVRQAREGAREARAAVRKAEVDTALARKTLGRSEELVRRGYISGDKLDRDMTGVQGNEAALAQSRSHLSEAEAAVAAAIARADSLRVALADATLKAPIAGRVLYRLAEPGEVLAAGGKVLTLIDLGDVFVTIFLPTAPAGKVELGSPARIVVDALPNQVIPATVSFVAPRSQFTPREVETRDEREKLMFRIKVRVDADWLAAHRDLVKGGMPAVAYVRTEVAAAWPASLQAR